jgi:hypothetical protein
VGVNLALMKFKGVFQKVGTKCGILVYRNNNCISLALIPNYIVKIVKSIVLPNDVDIYQEIEKDEKIVG